MRVLITGASSGVGLGLAQSYLAEGAEVYTCSRRKPDLPDHPFQSIDFAKLAEIPAKIEALVEGVNHFDLVILNAGMLGDIKDMCETSLDELDQVMKVNLWSNKVILDVLIAKVLSLPQIIAISSGAAVNGSRGWSGYSISKASLNMMVKLYAAENPTIHFTSFAPGLIDTAIQDDLCARTDARFPSIEKLKSARGTDTMPNPQVFATQFRKVLSELKDHPSGSFIDIRSL